MEMLLSVVLVAISIVSLVCWIATLIKIFKDNVGLGILGIICGLFAFIYGWVRTKEYDNKTVMLIWSICIVVGILVQVLGGAAIVTRILQSAGG